MERHNVLSRTIGVMIQIVRPPAPTHKKEDVLCETLASTSLRSVLRGLEALDPKDIGEFFSVIFQSAEASLRLDILEKMFSLTSRQEIARVHALFDTNIDLDPECELTVRMKWNAKCDVNGVKWEIDQEGEDPKGWSFLSKQSLDGAESDQSWEKSVAWQVYASRVYAKDGDMLFVVHGRDEIRAYVQAIPTQGISQGGVAHEG